MKYIFVIISSIILVFSLNEITPKFCINCKFFKNNFVTDPIYGKCYLFPKTEINTNYLITGIEKYIDYQYCSTVRKFDDMCGKEGKKYINKLSENEKV